jgi:hypothetical protein
MMTNLDYWKESISNAAENCGVELTDAQLLEMAEAVLVDHENYGMAFYSPPSTDRIAVIESEYRERYKRLQAEFDEYVGNANTAIRKALRLNSDAPVSIHEYGDVLLHGGRTEQVQ